MPVVFRPPANPSGGIIDFDGKVLTVEFEKPRFFRDPDIVQVDIPLAEIEQAQYRDWIIGGRLQLRTLYLYSAQQIPWRKSLDVSFTIPRREKQRAAALAARIEAAIEQQQSETVS